MGKGGERPPLSRHSPARIHDRSNSRTKTDTTTTSQNNNTKSCNDLVFCGTARGQQQHLHFPFSEAASGLDDPLFYVVVMLYATRPKEATPTKNAMIRRESMAC